MWFVCDWVVKTDFSQYCSRFGYSRIYSLIIQKVKVGDGMNNNCSRVSWYPFFFTKLLKIFSVTNVLLI